MNIFIGAKLNEEDLTKQGKSKELKEDAKEIKVQKEHILVFGLEKRKGKPVTLVGRFLLLEKEKKELLKRLKKSLACGGGIESEWIILQGDLKVKAAPLLEKWGWKIKKKNA